MSETAPRARSPLPWPDDPVEILRLLHPRLLAAARSVEVASAEDLVQEALVEVLSRHPDFRGISHPLGYAKVTMFRIAFRQRSSRRVEVPLEVAERLETRDPVDEVLDRLEVRAALEGLGRRQRACLVLRFAEGLDDDSIGAVLGCRPSTVRSQIARALSHMRSALDGAGEVEPT